MKKAFTLVELLGVIIILGVLALITFPIIDKSIKNSKEKSLERAIDNIEEAAYNYSITNDIGYETFYNKLSLEELKKAGFLEKETINPVTNENMTGCVLYKWDESKKQYEFKYEEPCSVKSIYETVLEQFPYLATDGNGCVTSTDNNYSYMGGCYLKGSIESGKDLFYNLVKQSGMDDTAITKKFFDSEGNFKLQEFETWYRDILIQGGIPEEEINQQLEGAGVDTLFELVFNMTSEELFAQKGLNNSLWYSGFLWRIMGINADGTIRLITDENVTSIPWKMDNTAENWDGSYAKEWLNNYFYPRLKENNIIVEQTWCNETTTDSLSLRTECTNNLSKEPAYVGLMTIDEYNLAGGTSSYLNIRQYQWTMTSYSSSFAWHIFFVGNIDHSVDICYAYGLRAVINVKSDIIITGGNGILGATWSSEIGPYILNENKNIEMTGKLNENATSGEYVIFDEKKYRVVDKDSNGNTKLILDGYYEENGSIFGMEYGDDNVFSTAKGIGQKLNGDVLEWLVESDDLENRNKMIMNYTWYQKEFDSGFSYKVSLDEKEPTRSIQATVGLIRVGEMLSSQSSSILTKGYTTTSSYDNANHYWTMTPSTIDSSSIWIINSVGDASNYVNGDHLLRPVIVIKSDVTITGGNGTWSNPYKI